MITYRALGQRGRLGNQLYELASTYGIAQARGEEPIFPADWIYRPFFRVPDRLFGPIPDTAVEAAEFAQHLDYRCRDYLQDINLFIDYLPTLRMFFQPSLHAAEHVPDLFSYFNLRETLGVHVRRGDNVVDPGVPNKADYHPPPSLAYYRRGIAHFSFVPHIVCVSDDIPWCRENIPAHFYSEGRAYFKEHEPEYGKAVPQDWVDFFLLAQCDYFVVTGSTFGIWAALLADVASSHVVRPNKVYGPLLSYIDSELLFDPRWEVISAA